MPLPNRNPFNGLKREGIIAFDLGTTFSGISYAILDPGKVQEIKTVMRYPRQEAGDSKIPTIIYYNAKGDTVAMGAEEPCEEEGSEGEWQEVEPLKVEWFKLLLRPPSTSSSDIPTATLPPNKSVTSVIADFFAYLFARVRAFICETHANGDKLWDSVKDNIRFVLSHPNGWEGAQQSAMRKAVVMAGLVPDTPEGHERVTFVSEGEVSFHYCVASGLVEDAIETGKNVMVIDAGGVTVDISTYAFTQAEPIKIEEIAVAECIFQGSVLVSKRASDYLADKLKGSRFGTREYIHAILEEFDKTTKKRFKGTGDSHVKFSSMMGDRNDQADIQRGQLKLSAIITAIEALRKIAAPAEISTYFLVGGFTASEFLYAKLHDYLEGHGLKLFQLDSHKNKVVAEGVVSFVMDHFVSSRVAKMAYGTYTVIPFNPTDPKHQLHVNKAYTGANGRVQIDSWFKCMVPWGKHVAEMTVFKMTLQKDTKDDQDEGYNMVRSDIVCYHDMGPCPRWMDEDPDMFTMLCMVPADVSMVLRMMRYDPNGNMYFIQEYTLVMSFGLTELRAHMVWRDLIGKEHRGPASVVYDKEFPEIIAKEDSEEVTAVKGEPQKANEEALVDIAMRKYPTRRA